MIVYLKLNSISRLTVIKYSNLVTSRVEKSTKEVELGKMFDGYKYSPRSLHTKPLFEQYFGNIFVNFIVGQQQIIILPFFEKSI